MKRYTSEMIDSFVAWKREGLCCTRIARRSMERYGYGSEPGIRKRLKKMGVDVRISRVWTQEMDENLIDWRAAGFTIEAIDKRLALAYGIEESFPSTKARIYRIDAPRRETVKRALGRPEIGDSVEAGYCSGDNVQIIAKTLSERLDRTVSEGRIRRWAREKKLRRKKSSDRTQWEPALRRLFALGLSDKELAAHFNVVVPTILRRRSLIGLLRKKHRTEKEIRAIDDFAITLRRRFHSCKEIAAAAAKQFNDASITDDYIFVRCIRNGVRYDKYGADVVRFVVLSLVAGFDAGQIARHLGPKYSLANIAYIRRKAAKAARAS